MSTENDTSRTFEGSDECIFCITDLIQSSQQDVVLLFDQLDNKLFNDESLINRLSQLLRQHPKANARMLLKTTKDIATRRNSLLELAKRLPSKMYIKELVIEPQNESINYIIGDRSHVLVNRDLETYSGYLHQDSRAEAQNLLEEFNELWERQSRDIPDLRQLRL